MSAHDDRVPDDELTRRYLEANAQDMRRPGAHVRQAVQAHAQAVLAARADDQPMTRPESMRAANQPRWKVSMLASIALAGLTGLLVLQFDRGTPEEKELALGQPRATAPVIEQPASPAVQEVSPTPLPQPPAAATSPEKSARPEARANKSMQALKSPEPATRPQPERKDAESGAESKAAPAQGNLSRMPQASPMQESAAAVPSPFPASPPAAMPAPPALADRALPAPATAPAPSAEARSQAARPQAGLAAAPRARAGNSGFVDARAALLEAARSGRSEDIAQLLRQGAPLNATDDAGRTPLMLAVMGGHEAAVQQLLALGADRTAADREGLTALAHARRLGLDRIAALIDTARQVK